MRRILKLQNWEKVRRVIVVRIITHRGSKKHPESGGIKVTEGVSIQAHRIRQS